MGGLEHSMDAVQSAKSSEKWVKAKQRFEDIQDDKGIRQPQHAETQRQTPLNPRSGWVQGQTINPEEVDGSKHGLVDPKS